MSKINWAEKYGMLQSPVEQLGLDQVIYKNSRKHELFTKTGDYLTARNTFFETESKAINKKFAEFMDRTDLETVPLIEKKRLGMDIVKNSINQMNKIADDLWPMADKALENAGKVNASMEIQKGNIIGDVVMKKGGRPPGSKNKTTKKKTKKSTKPKKSTKKK